MPYGKKESMKLSLACANRVLNILLVFSSSSKTLLNFCLAPLTMFAVTSSGSGSVTSVMEALS